MILKLKINPSRKRKIAIWMQRHKDFNQDIKQVLQFFKDQIRVSKKRRLFPYYRITSDNPAVLLSLFSTIQDMIPEIYFKTEESLEIEKIT